MADWVGRQLGNYSLTRLLGEGGFAEVYLGEHVHLGTQAAIKVLYTQLGEEDTDKFRIEARTIARLQHPNIVRVLDFGIENKKPFLVMDYAPNGTLRNKHIRGQLVPLSSIVSYVKQVAEALQCAHDEKMVHRDVKPENMLIGRRNEILLSDFGIATATQTSRQNTQDITGTVAYMSPEQIQGKPRSASDQYSLAIVAYEWLCGERPFNGSFSEIAVQHAVVPPPPLREKVPSLSPNVERVIMVALEKDPVKRFSSVQAFANTLEQASKGNAPTQVIPQQRAVASTVIVPSMVAPPVLPLVPTQYALMPEPAGTVIATYQGHSDRIRSVSWSPDSKYLAVGSNDKTATIWEVSTGRKILTYRGHSSWVNSVAWSPNNTFIATGSEDKTIHIWEARTGYQKAIINSKPFEVRGVTWSSDDKYIASTAYGGILVSSVDTGDRVAVYRSKYTTTINVISWSPDSRWIAAASNKKVVVWYTSTRQEFSVYKGDVGEVLDLAWSPDNTHIASVGRDKTAQVWSVATGKNLYVYRGHNDSVYGIGWSPNGKYIASGGRDYTVRVWSAVDGRDILILQHNATIRSVKWSPNGKYIASGGDDKIVQVWVAPQ